MKAVKTLHFADLHLGSDFRSLHGKALERRSDVKETFLSIIDQAKSRQVQLMLISGDLFDSWSVGEDNFNLVKNAFEGMGDTKIIIAPGNHDPLTPDSIYLREGFWPNNVIVLGKTYSSVVLDDLKVEVFGVGFGEPYALEPLMRRVSPKRPEYIQIGVVHGTLGVASEYNPISNNQILSSGLDYLALGHIHKSGEVRKLGETSYAYPGSPEGRGFDELGPHGVLVGEIGKNSVKMEFLPLCKRMYLELHCDLTGAESYKAGGAIILSEVYDNYGKDGEKHLYKIYLEGRVKENVSANLQSIKDLLANIYYVKFRDEMEPDVNLELLADEVSLKGIYVRKMLKELVHNDSAVIKKALTLGLRAFNGEVGYLED